MKRVLYEVFTNPKNPTTKEFVASTRTDIVPELVKKLDLHKEYTSGDKALVRLHFLGDSAGEPVITVLIKSTISMSISFPATWKRSRIRLMERS